MIAKLPFLRLSGKNYTRARLSACVSSVRRPKYIQTSPRYDQNPPDFHEFDAKIQSLKNKLHPETLIQVLSSTNDLSSSLQLFKWTSLQNNFRHTTDTYYHIIMKLGIACRIDEMEGYCNELVKCGFSGTEQALLGLIGSFIQYRRLDEASRVFYVLNSLRYKPSISLINSLLGALVEEKKGIKSVLFVYKEMVKASIIPTTETLNYLLEALFDADRVDAVLDQYKRMHKKRCCPNSRTYEIMVSGLIRNNLLDEALAVLNEILENECKFESKLFSCVLPLLFRMNKQDEGLRLFQKMKTLKIVPDLSIYEVLIEYFSKNLLMNDAINIFNEMLSNDLEAPDYVVVDLVNGFCMLNKLNEAKRFLEDRQVIEANSYNVLLDSYCQTSNFVEMLELFQNMVEKGIINGHSWNIFIRYFSENQRIDIVHKALSRMIVSGSMPDSVTYSALIARKCKSNEVDDAFNLFHRVHEERWVVDSDCYATLIESLCETDKIDEAAEVFSYMSSNKQMLRASSFSILIRHLCLIGKVEQAIKLPPHAYSNTDYSIIMKSLSKFSKGNVLLVILTRMVVEGCPLGSEAYNELIKGMSLHHRPLDCALFLNLMVNEGLLPDSVILADSLSCLVENSRLHMILPTIRKLVSDREVINPAIYNILINGLWKEGYKYEARWLLDVMLEKGWVPDGRTHRLLLNDGGNELLDYKQDEIISILSEGFREEL